MQQHFNKKALLKEDTTTGGFGGIEIPFLCNDGETSRCTFYAMSCYVKKSIVSQKKKSCYCSSCKMLFSPIQRMSSMQQLYLASNKNVMGTEMSKKCIYWQRLNYCPRPSRVIAKRLIAPIKCILPTPNIVRKYLHTRDEHYVSNYRISIPSAACHTKKRDFVCLKGLQHLSILFNSMLHSSTTIYVLRYKMLRQYLYLLPPTFFPLAVNLCSQNAGLEKSPAERKHRWPCSASASLAFAP